MGARINVGAIVSGRTEQDSLSRWIPAKNIRFVNSFGGTMSVVAMTRIAAPLIRLLLQRVTFVLIVLDREMRAEPAEELEREFQKLLAGAVPISFVGAVFADRMIENWMLADVTAIRRKKFIRSNARQRPYEGTDGCKELKRQFQPPFRYDKVLHGPQLLKVIRDDVAARNSGSFRRFISMVHGHA